MQYNEEEGTIKRVPEDEWIEKEKTVKLDFSVWIETSYSIELRVFEIVKEAAKKAGIRLRPNVMEGAKMYDLIWGEDGYRGDYDMLGWGWNIGVDPTFVLSWLSMYQIGAYSDSNWHNPEFNRIYKDQAREVDRQKRIEMIKRAQELVHEKLPYVVMYWPDKLDGYSEDFQGYVQQDLVGLTQDLTFMNVKPKE
jgi:peptide/nickel transport system substrate-binding protein